MLSSRFLRHLLLTTVLLGYAPIAQAQITITLPPDLGVRSAGPLVEGMGALGASAPLTWSLIGAPEGLRIFPGTGVPAEVTAELAGVLTPGTYTFSVRVTDATSASVTQPCTVTVTALTLLDYWQLPDAFTGVPYDFAFSVAGAAGPLTFTATSPLPGGFTLTSAGHLVGDPGTMGAGSYRIDVSVTDGIHTIGRGGLSLDVYGVRIATAGMLPNGNAGVSYSTTLAAAGGTGSYTWTASGLPQGFSLAGDGVLTAPAPQQGTYQFDAHVSDGPHSYTKRFVVNILPTPRSLPTLNIVGPGRVEDFTLGEARSLWFSVGGGVAPYTWSASGLPPGLTLRRDQTVWNTPPNNAEICCSAMAAGDYEVTISVTDSSSWTPVGGGSPVPATVTRTFTLHVAGIGFDNPASATLRTPYTHTLRVYGGKPPYSFETLGGSMPTGITFDTSTGTFSGTPLEPNWGNGLWIRVKDANNQTLTRQVWVGVNCPPNNVSINSGPELWYGWTNRWYDFWLNGWAVAGMTWTPEPGSQLPAGLFLSGDGHISGTVTAPPGTYTFRIRAAESGDPSKYAVREFTIVVTPFNLTSAVPSWAQVGTPYSAQLTAAGGTTPLHWTIDPISVLPPGLSLSSDGLITGTPTSAGQFNFNVVITDSASPAHEASMNFVISIYPSGVAQPVAIGFGPDFGTRSAGANTWGLWASGGTPPYTWSVSGAPEGVRVFSNVQQDGSGELAGVFAPGTHNFALTVTDGAGSTATQDCSVKITSLTFVNVGPPNAFKGQAYDFPFAVSGAAGPLTFTAGSLPPGFSLTADGHLVANPNALVPGGYGVSLSVSDGTSTLGAGYGLNVYDVHITTDTTLPNAQRNVNYSTTLAASGGTPPYAWTAWGLPAGSTITPVGNGATATLAVPAPPGGHWGPTVQVQDAVGATHQKHFLLGILDTPPSLPMLEFGSAFDDLTVGQSRFPNFWTNSGVPPYSWSATGLPPGVSLISGTQLQDQSNHAELAGTPTATGSYPVAISLTDSSAWVPSGGGQPVHVTTTRPFTLKVTTIGINDPPAATLRMPYSQPLRVYGGKPGYTFEVVRGGAPPTGITFDPSTGMFSGTPLEPNWGEGMRVRVTDANGQTFTRNVWIAVNCPSTCVTITTNHYLPDTGTGQWFDFRPGFYGAPSAAWSVEGTLPAGLTLDGDGRVSGTVSAAAGTYTFRLRATDTTNAANYAIREFQVVVVAASDLAVGTNLPWGRVDSSYTTQLTATGGTAPYQWQVEPTSALPPGLSLSTAGVLSGIPTSAGQFSFGVLVTDSTTPVANSRTQWLNLSIYPAGVSQPITMGQGPDFGTRSAGKITFDLWASGGTAPYSWTINDAPDGMRVYSNAQPDGRGMLGAVLATPGTYHFNLTVSDAAGSSATQACTLTVTALTFLDDYWLPDAFKGQAYDLPVAVSGAAGPLTFTSGSLPAGFELTGDGHLRISDQNAVVPGIYNGNFSVSDGTSSIGRGFRLDVYGVQITTPGILPNGTVGSNYSTTFTASGGTGSYTWIDRGIPGGFSLSSSGELTATAPSPGRRNVTVEVRDSAGQSLMKNFIVTIIGTPPTVPSLNLPSPIDDLTVGDDRPLGFSVDGGVPPYTWTATGLPPGMTLRTSGPSRRNQWPNDAEICCVPLAAGNYPVTISVTDSSAWTPAGGGSAVPVTVTRSFTLRVTTIAMNYPQNATLGSPYTEQLRTYGGKLNHGFEVLKGMPPAGISFNTSTGAFSGTPLGPNWGSSGMTVRVTDANGQTLTRSFWTDVWMGGADAGTVARIDSDNYLPDAVAGQPYDRWLNGWAPAGVTWSVESGSLPPGLALGARDGRLQGTPTSPGTYLFQVRVTEVGKPSNFAVRQFQLVITPITFTANNVLAWGQVGTAYSAALGATGGTLPYQWTVEPTSMPPGLSLSSTGVLSGTPTSAGQFNFGVVVKDSATPAANSATQWLNLSIYPAGVTQPIVITDGSDLGVWQEGENDFQLHATGGSGPYTWALVSGTLPPGLSIRPDGADWFNPRVSPGIIGIATTPGTYDFTLSATSNGATGTKAFHVVVTPLNIKDDWTLPDAFVNVPYTYTFQTVGASGPVTWSVRDGCALPAGFSLDPTTGTLTVNTATSGAYQVCAVATSGSDRAQRTFNVTVRDVQITTSSLPVGTQGTTYSATLTASGGRAPYTWRVDGGLPQGITWAESAGSLTLSGTPTGAGTWTVQVTATDSSQDKRFHSKRFSLNVVGVPPTLPSISTGTPLNDATVGMPGRYSFWANGGAMPYTWSITNAPPGMELRTTGLNEWTAIGQAELVGTVQTEGSYTFDITMTDSSTPPIVVKQTYTLHVSALMLQTCCGYLPGSTYDTPYSTKIRILGGKLRDVAPVPYTFEVLPGGGKLPANMTLAADGTLSGAPKEAGNFNVWLRVSDANDPAKRLTVNFGFFVSGGQSNTVWINTGYQLWATSGVPFSRTLNACCLPGYKWESTTLPSWLSIGETSGTLTGTPPAAGSYAFLVKVSDPTNAANFNVREFILTVSSLQFSGQTWLPYANVGTLYSTTLTATGGTTTWSVARDSMLPPGLELNATTGVLSGTPTSAGQFNFNVLLSAGVGDTRSVNLTLPIYPSGEAPPLGFNFGPDLGTMNLGSIRWQLQANSGVPPYHYSLSPGATVIAGMRVKDAGPPQPTWFSTTPTQAGGFLGVLASPGTFSTIIRATDGAGHFADRPVTYTVSPVMITSLDPLPDAAVGAAYSVTLAAVGGTPQYLWEATSGSLPSWLSLSASGTLTGTPPAEAAGQSFRLNLKVTDAALNVAATWLSVNVQPFAITTSVLPIGVQNTPYTATLSASACPCTWNWQGGLPGGLSLDAATGVLSGTTSNWGTWSAWVNVTSGSRTARKYVTLFVQPSPAVPIQANFAASAVATIGGRYSFQLGTQGGTPPYTWSVLSGSLPAGVTLQAGDTTGNNNAPGVWYLVGVPMAVGTSTLTLRVTDGASQTLDVPFTFVVSPITIDGDYRNLPISGSPNNYGGLGLPLIYNQPYTQPLLALGGSGVYTWAVETGSAMPTGLVLSGDGTVSGTPAVTGNYSAQIRVTDSNGDWYYGNVNFNIRSNQTATVTINNGPDLGTYSLATSNSWQTLNATGGTPPYTFSVAAGSSLPPGFALVAGPGGSTLLAYTPLASGTFTFTIAVKDSTTPTAIEGAKTFTVRIAQNTIIGSTALSDASVGVAYSQQLYAWGASAAWSQAPGNTLPPGLTLSAGGLLSGTPNTAGTYTFQLRVTDSAGVIQSRTYTLKVSPLAIDQPGVLPTGTVGTPYPAYTLTGTGGASFSMTGGSLPNGLTLAPNGVISGTPTASGIWNFTATATSGTSTVSRLFVLAVADAFVYPLTANLGSGSGTDKVYVTVGRNFAYYPRAAYGVPPYTWSVTSGSLPPGLSLLFGAALPAGYAADVYMIAGMPNAPGTYPFTLTVQDSAGKQATATLTIVVSPIALIAALPAATYNVAYTAQLAAAGGAGGYTFAVANTSAMPAGLSLSPTGVISGTPTDTGSLPFEVVVTDSGGASCSGRYSLTVNSPSPRTVSLMSGTFAPASLGVYRAITLSANTMNVSQQPTPFTWSLDNGTLPPGMTLVPSSGTNGNLIGAPTTAGTYTFRLRVTDNAANWGVHTYSLVVSPLQIQSVLDDAVVGVAITRPMVVSGGAHAYSVALAPGVTNVLPPGLSISADGTIAGTPTASGVFSFTVNITDGDGATMIRTLSMAVWPAADGIVPLQPSSTSATTGSVGAVYTYNLNNMVYGGTQPYRWTLASGSTLPPGLQITTGTSTIADYITGIPTTAGSYNFTLTVTDSSSPAKSRSVAATMTVSPLTIGPLFAPAATVGTFYSLPIAVSGGTGALALSLASNSSMPPGLAFSGGVISGTPSAAGRFSVLVKATDSAIPANEISKSFAINVDAPAMPTPFTSLDQPVVQFTYTQGGPLPAPASVAITSTSTNVAYNAAVLGIPGSSLAGAPGTTPGAISIGFSNASALNALVPGLYGGLLATNAPSSVNRTAVVPIRLRILAAPVCTFTLETSSATAVTGGGPGTVKVKTDAACAWTASSNASWLTVTGGGGYGDGTVSYNVAANADAQRTGTLTVAGQTFTVTQFGTTCTFQFDPSSVAETAGGSTPTVTIAAANTGCHWSATSSEGWLQITSATTGTGGGPLTFRIAANGSPSTRTGTISLTGDATATLSVSQTGISCTVALSAAGTTVPAAGGSGTVDVVSAPCGYSTVVPPQVTVTAGASGSGPGTVAFTVAPNTTTTPRTLTMQIGGQSFTIAQAGVTCSVDLSSSGIVYAAAGASDTIGVDAAAASCGWTASASATWVVLSSGWSGTGDGNVVFSVAPNPTTFPRSATVTVGGRTVQINQAGTSCSYSLRSAAGSMPAVGGSSTAGVIAASNCSWTAARNASWLSLVASDNIGSGYVYFEAESNPLATPRTGTLTIAGQTFTVTQAGAPCSYTLSASDTSMTEVGGTATFTFTAGAGGCTPTVQSYSSWIQATSTFDGASGTVTLTVQPNGSPGARTGRVVVGDQTYTVTQAGATTCTYSLNEWGALFSKSGGPGTLLASATSAICQPVAASSPEVTLAQWWLFNNIYTQPYTVAAYNSPVVWVRVLEINFGGQVFKVKQTSW